MNGPMKMFPMRQIVRHDFQVELPNCMYKMKNIHASDNGKTINGMVDDGVVDHVSSPRKKLDISDQNNKNVPGMAELQHRQEEILKQLAELKKQMLSIKNQLKNHSQNTATNASVSTNSSTANTEIVLNVNPQNPPYSLEFVQKVLQNTIHIIVTTYTHSTVNTLPATAKELSDKLTSFSPKTNSVPKVNLKLIWKNVDDKFELMVSHTPIIGEVNFLRYVSRMCSNALSYDDLEVDSLLDVCYSIVISKNKTQRAKLLQTFTNIISKQGNYLTKNSFGIVDVAAYSAIKQVTSNDELNVTLNKWMKKCESTV